MDEMKGRLPNESVGTMGSRVVSDDGLCFMHISCMLFKHRKQIGSVEAMLCHTKATENLQNESA